jgi:glutathione S-transferase
MIEKTTRHPVFWSFRRCPYVMRARLAVCSAGIQVELREILLRDKPEAFLQASPKGTVPVVQLADGTVLEESRDVMQWALARNDPDGWLDVQHRDPEGTAAFLDALDGPFKTHLDRYKYASRFDPEAALKYREAGVAMLAEFDAKLAAQPSLSGKKNGLLDFASLPFVRQFRIADPVWFDARPWPHLHHWLQTFLASSQFASVMKKYAVWQEGGNGVAFPETMKNKTGNASEAGPSVE